MLQEIWYFLQILKKQEDAYVPIEGLLGLAGPNLWVVATLEKSVGKVPKTRLKKGGRVQSLLFRRMTSKPLKAIPGVSTVGALFKIKF